MTVCTQAAWVNDIGNAGETIVTCRTCGTYQGNPCRKRHETNPDAQAATLANLCEENDVAMPRDEQQALAMQEIAKVWLSLKGRTSS